MASSFTDFGKTVMFDIDAAHAQKEIIDTEKGLQSLLDKATMVGKSVSKSVQAMLDSFSNENQIEVFINTLSGGLEKCQESVTSFSRVFSAYTAKIGEQVEEVKKLTSEYDALDAKLKQLDASDGAKATKGSKERLEYEQQRAELLEQMQAKQDEKSDKNSALAKDYQEYAQMRDSGDIYSTENVADSNAVQLYQNVAKAVLEYRNAVVALLQTDTGSTSKSAFVQMVETVIGKLNNAIDLGNQYRELVGEEAFSNNEASIAMPEKEGLQEFVNAQIEAYDQIEQKAREVGEEAQQAIPNAVKKTEKDISKGESSFDGLVDTSRDVESLEELEMRINRCKGDIAEMREQAKQGSPEDNITEIIQSIEEAEKELKRYEKMRDAVYGKRIEVPKNDADKSYVDVLKEIPRLEDEIKRREFTLINSNNIERDKAEIESLKKELKSLQAIRDAVDAHKPKSEPKYEQYGRQVAPTDPNAIASKDVSKQIEETQKLIDQKKAWLPLALDSEKALAEIDALEKRLKNLQSIQIRLSDDGNLDQKIQTVAEEIERLKGMDRTLPITENIKNLEAELERLTQRKRELEESQQSAQPQTMSLKDAKARYKELPKEMEQARRDISGSGDVEGSISRLKELEAEYKRLGQIINEAQGSNPIGENIRQSFERVGNSAKRHTFSVKGFFDALKKAGGVVGKLKQGFGNAVGGIKSLGNRMANITKRHTPNMLKSLMSIKSMLKRRVKRTFISAIFNQAKEGLQELAKYSSGFNSAMSTIKNSSKEAAGNLAVTLGNLVQMIAPALETLLGWLTKILQAINSVFALISGKGTVTVAKKSTDDYAKSLKKAGGAAKDLNRQLYGFDEITRQEDNSGGGGGGSKIGYEEKTIDDILGGELKKKFEDIINAFKSGQFRKCGQLVGEVLGEVVTIANDKLIEWRSVTKKWAKNVAELGNGFVEGFNWDKLGELFGNGLNLIFDTLNTFLKEFDFEALGGGIADSVVGMFEAIEWDMLGETFANGFNAVFDFVFGYIENMDWGLIGDSIAEGISSFLDNIDFDRMGDILVEGISGVVEMLWSFLEGVDWEQYISDILGVVEDTIREIPWKDIATLIARGLSTAFKLVTKIMQSGVISDFVGNIVGMIGTFLEEVDYEELGTALGAVVQELLNSVIAIVQEVGKINWKKIGKNVAKGINNIFTAIDFADAAQSLSTALTDLIESVTSGITELISNIDWGAVVDSLVSFVTNIDWESIYQTFNEAGGKIVGTLLLALADIGEKLWEVIKSGWDSVVAWWESLVEENGGNIIAALYNGIKQALSTVATWVYDNVIHPFVSGLESALGLDNGTIVETAKKLWETFKQAVLDAWQSIKDFATDVWTGFSTWVSTTWETAKTGVATAISSVWTTITENWKTVKDVAGDIWAGVSEWITTTWNAVSASVVTAVTNAWDTITGAWKTIKDGAQDIWSGVADWIGEKWEACKSWVVGKVTNAWASIKDAWGLFKDSAPNIWSGIADWIEEKWNGCKTWVIQKVQDAWNSIKGVWGTLKETASNIWDGFLTGVSSGWETIKQSVTQIFSGAWESMKGAFNDVWMFARSIWTGLKKGLHDGWENLKNSLLQPFKDLWKAILDFFGIHSPSTEANSVGQNILNGLVAGFEAIIDTVVETVKKIFGKIWDAILGIFGLGKNKTNEEEKSGEQAGKDIMTGIQKGITGDEEPVKKAAKTAAQNILKAMRDEFGIPENGDGASSKTKGFAEGLIKGINKGFEEKATDGAFSGGMNKTRTAIIEAFKKAFDIRGGDIWSGEAWSEKMKDTGKPIIHGIVKGIQENISGFDEMAKGVADKIAGITFTETQGAAIVQSLFTGMSNLLKSDETVATDASAFANNVKEKIDDVLSNDIGIEIGNAFASGVADGVGGVETETVDSWVDSIYESPNTKLTESNGHEIGDLFGAGIVNGVSDTDSTAITQWAKGVRDEADATLSMTNGWYIGSNVIIGMINGMNAYGQMLVNTIAHICNVTADTARAILGIASPSKVFAEIGAYTMEGMQEGIEASGREAIKTVGDVTTAIVDEGLNTGDVAIEVDSMVDGLDVVANKMSRIAEIFSGIADTILQMGGLEIPSIANGQVLPYKTRIDSGSGVSLNPMGEHGLEDALYNALTRAMSNNNSEQPIEIKLIADGKTLSDIVTTYQRRQNRAWGL